VYVPFNRGPKFFKSKVFLPMDYSGKFAKLPTSGKSEVQFFSAYGQCLSRVISTSRIQGFLSFVRNPTPILPKLEAVAIMISFILRQDLKKYLGKSPYLHVSFCT
jgi:hypothetical protein